MNVSISGHPPPPAEPYNRGGYNKGDRYRGGHRGLFVANVKIRKDGMIANTPYCYLEICPA